jgi:hypothetical protein
MQAVQSPLARTDCEPMVLSLKRIPSLRRMPSLRRIPPDMNDVLTDCVLPDSGLYAAPVPTGKFLYKRGNERNRPSVNLRPAVSLIAVPLD